MRDASNNHHLEMHVQIIASQPGKNNNKMQNNLNLANQQTGNWQTWQPARHRHANQAKPKKKCFDVLF